MEMNKLALLAASVAVLGFANPSFASDGAAQGRIQLAQAAGVSVSVGDGPRVRSGVVVRHDRGYHRGYRHGHRHYGRSNNVVIVKKRAPARKTVIIER
jgi:hypothetical protein